MRFVLLLLTATTALCVHQVHAEALPRPAATVSFLDPGAFLPGIYPAKRAPTAADLRAKVRAMDQVGIKTIVVTYVEYIANNWGAFYPSSLPELKESACPLGFDFLDTVMDEADRTGQAVMLGVGRGKDPTLTYTGCDDPLRLAAAQSLATRVVHELVRKYATRHPCFGGWYFTHECRNLAYASRYYNRVADLCHQVTPGKPVMIAPDGAPVADAEVIAKCHVDILAYQDAVGAGFTPAPKEYYSFEPAKRLATLGALFRKYAGWHRNTDKQIWAVTELWQMDGPDYANAYPADWARVKRQLEAVRPYVSQIAFYEFGGFMESPDSQAELGGPRAVRLFTAYQKWLTGGKLKGG